MTPGEALAKPRTRIHHKVNKKLLVEWGGAGQTKKNMNGDGPIIVDSPKRQLASMNIPAPKAPKKEAVKPQHIAQPKPQNPVQSTPQAKAANEGQYAIVICTLSSEAQVAEFFKWNKDINPTHVMKKNKHYMIYYQRDNDFIKLKNVAKSMPKRYANYWITKV